MTEPNDDTHEDLGHMVAVWEVTETSDGGRLFDLNDLEDRASGCFEEESVDLCEQMTLWADRLPKGAYIIVCFPGEEVADAGAAGDEHRGTGDDA